MTGLDRYDDASRDHERFETELVAQDRDAARVETDDVDETEAQQLVSDLVEREVVIPIAEQRVLAHEPSETAFESISNLAQFHRGWMAAQNAGDEN